MGFAFVGIGLLFIVCTIAWLFSDKAKLSSYFDETQQ